MYWHFTSSTQATNAAVAARKEKYSSYCALCSMLVSMGWRESIKVSITFAFRITKVKS
jgi:hypothetical protein